MLYNLLSIIGLCIFITVLIVANKKSFGRKLIKILSIILILFKTSEYIIINLSGSFNYPIEISTITYFLFSIVFIFDIRKAYHIASFLGVISGVGFFVFYGCFGFLSPLPFNIVNLIISIYSHGVILIGGLYLFYNYTFTELKKYHLIIAMLLIICHAAIFQLDTHINSTFISLLISPDYYLRLSNGWINHLLKLILYMALFYCFQIIVNRFYYWNNYLHNQKSQTS